MESGPAIRFVIRAKAALVGREARMVSFRWNRKIPLGIVRDSSGTFIPGSGLSKGQFNKLEA
jgi:hypothetical protein